MTLKELRESRALWLGRRTRARAAHRRYVRLTRRSVEGSARHARLWVRRAHWSRAAKHADRMYRTRDRQLRAREPQQISEAGMDFLVREEGIRRYAYNDSEGHATFGVGHLLHRGNVTSADRAKWGTPESPKSLEFVFDVLDKDLDRFEKVVRDSIKGGRIPTTRFDAMVSLAVNIGEAGFAGSTVVRRYNAGDIQGAANAILMWDDPAVLKPRRSRERSLFLR